MKAFLIVINYFLRSENCNLYIGYIYNYHYFLSTCGKDYKRDNFENGYVRKGSLANRAA
jgi:hypothetical protein